MNAGMTMMTMMMMMMMQARIHAITTQAKARITRQASSIQRQCAPSYVVYVNITSLCVVEPLDALSHVQKHVDIPVAYIRQMMDFHDYDAY
jgi:hypothetical protein